MITFYKEKKCNNHLESINSIGDGGNQVVSDIKRTYHFSSAVCSVNEYNSVIVSDRYKTAQAGIKLFRVFCDGFVQNNQIIRVFSKRPTTRLKSGKNYIPSKDEVDNGVEYHYCRSVNFPILGLIYSFLASFFWYLSSTKCKREDIVFIDPLNVSIGYGTQLACKLRGIKTIMILTDLPRFYCYNGTGKMSTQQKLSEKLSKMASAYVLVTRQMNEVVNEKGKPSIVMEGFVDTGLEKIHIPLCEKYESFVCMYTGGLDKAYGLDMLLEGFIEADLPDSELHIYGGGKFAGEIQKAAENHANIKYFGCKDNSEVVIAQMKATLLINPRYTDAEFTKYSFPGKNLEYAASGTPTLTTLLPGMPSEYLEHVFILKDETVSGLAKELIRIYQKSRQELYEFGADTKKWMLSSKNCKAQIARILEFTDKI